MKNEPKRKFENPEVNVGDKVRIEALGTYRIGVVESVVEDWQDGSLGIEMRDDVFGQVYWKQWVDGGTVEVLDE